MFSDKESGRGKEKCKGEAGGSHSFIRTVIALKMLTASDMKYGVRVKDGLASSGMQISISQTTFLKSLA